MFARFGKARLGTTDTLIGESSFFNGKLKSEATLRIEGKFVGDIECAGDVVIGVNSRVQSNITARNVITAGMIEGSITTREMLKITATGKVHGDIRVKSLSIFPGGVFQGSSEMESSRAAAAAKPEKAEEEKNRVAKVEKFASVKSS